jgi:DeoR/GlpR family transcriptional regulator of sugar metabolism
MEFVEMQRENDKTSQEARSSMLAIDRRRVIHDRLLREGSVIVADLARELSVSDETVRRDLAQMEGEGLLVKTYGGAYVQEGMHRVIPSKLRERTGVEAKRIIGTLASEMIHDGATVFLDSSTTALHVAEQILTKQNVVVITNSLRTAEILAEGEGIRVISVGGTVRHSTLSTVGRGAERLLGQYFADIAFVSCDGLHLTRGITDSSEEEAQIRRKMIEQANRAVLIADATKFDRTSFVSIARMDELDCLLTDKPPNDRWVALLGQFDVSVHCQDLNTEDVTERPLQ